MGLILTAVTLVQWILVHELLKRSWVKRTSERFHYYALYDATIYEC